MASESPQAQWQYSIDCDWQPFAVLSSQDIEDAYVSWCGGGTSLVHVRSGELEFKIDFSEMQCSIVGVQDTCPRHLRREEHFTLEHVTAWRKELECIHAERDALLTELASMRVALASGDMSARTSASAAAASAWPVLQPKAPPRPVTGASSCHSHVMGGMTPSACTQVSGASWRSATSNGSGLFAVSPGSLESIAEWVFSLNAHGVQPTNAYERVLVPSGDPRRQWLEDYLVNSLQPHRTAYNSEEWCPRAEVQVMKIWEVINEASNQAYRRELVQMLLTRPRDRTPVPELDAAIHVRTDLSAPRLNESLLFHGCKWETVFAILREGFDSRLGGINAGAAFGIGTYFSTVASKADQYTQRWVEWDRRPPCQVPAELRCMLVGRVALGEVHERPFADQSLRRPPLGPDGVRCESVLGVPRARGGCVDYDEFIIYKCSQATPQFVIEYEHKPGCRCRACVSPSL